MATHMARQAVQYAEIPLKTPEAARKPARMPARWPQKLALGTSSCVRARYRKGAAAMGTDARPRMLKRVTPPAAREPTRCYVGLCTTSNA
jgi:hypothetical protein